MQCAVYNGNIWVCLVYLPLCQLSKGYVPPLPTCILLLFFSRGLYFFFLLGCQLFLDLVGGRKLSIQSHHRIFLVFHMGELSPQCTGIIKNPLFVLSQSNTIHD